jgi:hypothetical protein
MSVDFRHRRRSAQRAAAQRWLWKHYIAPRSVKSPRAYFMLLKLREVLEARGAGS